MIGAHVPLQAHMRKQRPHDVIVHIFFCVEPHTFSISYLRHSSMDFRQVKSILFRISYSFRICSCLSYISKQVFL